MSWEISLSFDLRYVYYSIFQKKRRYSSQISLKQQVSNVSIYPRLSTCFKCTESFPLSNKAENMK